MTLDPKHVVLVVDDEPAMRAYLRARLSRGLVGAEVFEAANGDEALRVLRERDVTLVLSDHFMAGMDGVTLLSEVRRLSPRTARVLLTGNPDMPLVLRALNDGHVHALFPKPFEMERLLGLSQRFLDERADMRRTLMALARAVARPPAPGNEGRPVHRVLVVDDVPQVARFFSDVARRLPAGSVEVSVECDPRTALERIRKESFDVIVSDYRMRHLTGVDLLLAARTFLPRSRRILVTGYNEVPESPERLRAAEIHAYMHKPVPTQAALHLLQAAVSPERGAMDLYETQARMLEETAVAAGAPLHLE